MAIAAMTATATALTHLPFTLFDCHVLVIGSSARPSMIGVKERRLRRRHGAGTQPITPAPAPSGTQPRAVISDLMPRLVV